MKLLQAGILIWHFKKPRCSTPKFTLHSDPKRASCAVRSQSFATEMFNTEAYPLYWHREQAVQSDHRALLQRCSTLKLTLYTDTESKLCSQITELSYRDVQHWSLPFILTQRASCAVWSQSFPTEMFNTEAYPLYWHREQAVQSDHRALLQRCSTLKLTLYTDTESKLCSLITELCYSRTMLSGYWSSGNQHLDTIC